MVSRTSVLQLASLAFVFAALAIRSSSAIAQHIPSVQSTTFSNAKIDLPEDLNDKVGILVLGFSQNSRDALIEWDKKLAPDYDNSPKVLYYEMPVLTSVSKMMRGFITGKIKSSTSESARAHFLPLLDNELSWRALAHYNKPDDAYILLIDGTGLVRWQSQGPPTDATYSTLKQKVDSLHPH